MANDNLKEILGFDPDTGERAEENNTLLPLQKNGSYDEPVIPSEVQDLFLQKYNGVKFSNSEVIRVVPEDLLVVLQHIDSQPGINRTYYSYGYTKEGQGKPTFFPSASTFFTLEDGKTDIADLWRYSEQPQYRRKEDRDTSEQYRRPQDQIWMSFRLRGARRDPRLLFRADLQGRELLLTYDLETLSIDQMSFPCTDDICYHDHVTQITFANEQHNDPSDPRNVDFLLEQLSEKREIKHKFKNEAYTFSLQECEEGNDKIVVARIVAGKPADNLVIPYTQDRERIIQELFPRPLVEDPIDSSSELDRAWRNENIFKLMGIDWQRTD